MHSPVVTNPLPAFWEGLAARAFGLPRCEACAAWQGPDAVECQRCGGPLAWVPASGSGTVYSLMEPQAPGDAREAVEVLTVIGLDEGPRLMGVVEARPGTLEVGARIAASYGARDTSEGGAQGAPQDGVQGASLRLPAFTLSAK